MKINKNPDLQPVIDQINFYYQKVQDGASESERKDALFHISEWAMEAMCGEGIWEEINTILDKHKRKHIEAKKAAEIDRIARLRAENEAFENEHGSIEEWHQKRNEIVGEFDSLKRKLALKNHIDAYERKNGSIEGLVKVLQEQEKPSK